MLRQLCSSAAWQIQDWLRFVEAGELASLGQLAAKDLAMVFTGHHDLGHSDQGCEKPVQFFQNPLPSRPCMS